MTFFAFHLSRYDSWVGRTNFSVFIGYPWWKSWSGFWWSSRLWIEPSTFTALIIMIIIKTKNQISNELQSNKGITQSFIFHKRVIRRHHRLVENELLSPVVPKMVVSFSNAVAQWLPNKYDRHSKTVRVLLVSNKWNTIIFNIWLTNKQCGIFLRILQVKVLAFTVINNVVLWT